MIQNKIERLALGSNSYVGREGIRALSNFTVQAISLQRRVKTVQEPKTLRYTITISVLYNKNIELSQNSVVRTANHFFY